MPQEVFAVTVRPVAVTDGFMDRPGQAHRWVVAVEVSPPQSPRGEPLAYFQGRISIQ